MNERWSSFYQCKNWVPRAGASIPSLWQTCSSIVTLAPFSCQHNSLLQIWFPRQISGQQVGTWNVFAFFLCRVVTYFYIHAFAGHCRAEEIWQMNLCLIHTCRNPSISGTYTTTPTHITQAWTLLSPPFGQSQNTCIDEEATAPAQWADSERKTWLALQGEGELAELNFPGCLLN